MTSSTCHRKRPNAGTIPTATACVAASTSRRRFTVMRATSRFDNSESNSAKSTHTSVRTYNILNSTVSASFHEYMSFLHVQLPTTRKYSECTCTRRRSSSTRAPPSATVCSSAPDRSSWTTRRRTPFRSTTTVQSSTCIISLTPSTEVCFQLTAYDLMFPHHMPLPKYCQS